MIIALILLMLSSVHMSFGLVYHLTGDKRSWFQNGLFFLTFIVNMCMVALGIVHITHLQKSNSEPVQYEQITEPIYRQI